MRNKALIPIVEMQIDDRMQQERGGGGVNCCVLCLRFFPLILQNYHNKIKLKLKMKKIKGDKDFTWKPSWPNKKEKPRPPGISKFSLCFRQSITIT